MTDRKARLAALAAKAGRTKTKNSEEVDDRKDQKQELNENNKRAVSFRNYAPNDTSMDEEKDAKKQKIEEKTEEKKTSVLQEALQEAQSDISTSKSKQQNAITDMAPKKVNWDLKRDIQEKLSKLERRTQKAIVELLKERLEREAIEETNEDSDLD